MSFRDELNSIRPDMKMISEQEMYETILHEIYEKIKNNIREDAKIKVYNNKLTGVVDWEKWIGKSGLAIKNMWIVKRIIEYRRKILCYMNMLGVIFV